MTLKEISVILCADARYQNKNIEVNIFKIIIIKKKNIKKFEFLRTTNSFQG